MIDVLEQYNEMLKQGIIIGHIGEMVLYHIEGLERLKPTPAILKTKEILQHYLDNVIMPMVDESLGIISK